MKPVSIVGVGMIAGARTLVAIHCRAGGRSRPNQALDDAGLAAVDALYIGNAYGATFNQQTQLGSLDRRLRMGLAGLRRSPARPAMPRAAWPCARVIWRWRRARRRRRWWLGSRKRPIWWAGAQHRASVSLDHDYESVNGATLTAMAALLMRRYMFEHAVDSGAFRRFQRQCPSQWRAQPKRHVSQSMLRAGAFAKAPMIADPVSLFDSAPDADGAAALVLAPADEAADLVPQAGLHSRQRCSNGLALCCKTALIRCDSPRSSRSTSLRFGPGWFGARATWIFWSCMMPTLS